MADYEAMKSKRESLAKFLCPDVDLIRVKDVRGGSGLRNEYSEFKLVFDRCDDVATSPEEECATK